ncbi:hypothetical protein J4450_03245 [Candidatus Micrarchaeota archaeon]|nr:hypothetical protein [Candidatus Micrarchaeota archaeon]
MQKLERSDNNKATVIDFNHFKNLLSGQAFIERCIKKHGSANDFSPSYESFVEAVGNWRAVFERLKEEKMDIVEDPNVKEIVSIITDKTQPIHKRIEAIRQFFKLEPREKYRWRPPEPFIPFPPIASYMINVFSKIAFDENEDVQLREKAIGAMCKINYRWCASIEL